MAWAQPIQTLLYAALYVSVAAMTLWGGAALFFQLKYPYGLSLALLWGVLGLSSLFALWRHTHGDSGRGLLIFFLIACVFLLAWWHTLKPSHDRVWADDVSQLLRTQVNGNHVTLRNVRNFDWRSETDYTPRWETREYDISQLTSADLILSYWMGPTIAHTLISFGFEDGQRVVFSLEIRKERHEEFSAIGGFFRQFEQIIVAADESDIVRVRSNIRGEDVYLYPLNLKPAQIQSVFMAYVETANALYDQPRFYNSLTSNCTTIIFHLARGLSPTLPLDYRLLLSGYFAEYAYDHGGLAPGYPFAELRTRAHINARAAGEDAARDFSTAIRK